MAVVQVYRCASRCCTGGHCTTHLNHCGVCSLAHFSSKQCIFMFNFMILLSLLQEAVLQCVHMPRANLEGAVLKGCSMDERLGVSTNLEGEECMLP